MVQLGLQIKRQTQPYQIRIRIFPLVQIMTCGEKLGMIQK